VITIARGFEGGIPSAAAAAVSQMLATVSRLGGRAYIPWSPAIGPSVFGNSDGSGGVPGVGGAVGLLLDSSGGWGAGSDFLANNDFATWSPAGTPPTPSGNSFTTTATNSGYVKSFPQLITGNSYLIRAVGTTTAASGALRLRGNVTGLPDVLLRTGPGFFDVTQAVVWTETSSAIYLFSAQPGTVSFTTLEVRALPTALATALTQATGINKPLLASGAVPWAGALVFDGSNDSLTTGNIVGSATECVVWSGAVRDVVSTDDLFGHQTTAAAGTFVGRFSAGTYGMACHDGTTFRSIAVAPVVANEVATFTFVKGASRIYIRKNSIEGSTLTTTIGAQAAPAPLTYGTGAAGFLDALGYCFVWVPTEPSAADLAVLERGAAAIAGLPI
jgi:hypothetical protein